MHRVLVCTRVIALAISLCWAAPAAAQQYSSSSGAEVKGFVAPELKITTFDHFGARLIGVSAGTIQGHKMMFGIAVHTLLSGARNKRNLTYGGVFFGWVFNDERPVTLIARTLVGYGRVRETDPNQAFDFPEGVSGVIVEPEVGITIQKKDSRARFLILGGYRHGTRSNFFEPSASGANVTTSVQFVF